MFPLKPTIRPILGIYRVGSGLSPVWMGQEFLATGQRAGTTIFPHHRRSSDPEVEKERLMKYLSFSLSVVAATVFALGAMNAQSAAPAGATGVCKDGTYTTAASKSGACRGHKGIKQWLSSTSTSPATAAPSSKAAMPAPTPAPAAAPAPAAMPAPAPKPASHVNVASRTAAPGGGAGMVWVNTETNVYHCSGSQFYGKTKQGAYMSEADAKAKGARPDHNHPCTK
jgi:hypothetical protein